MYQIIENIPTPESTPRTRKPGEFSIALNALNIGAGFEYTSNSTAKAQYPRINPKKFGGKRFRVWLVSEGENGGPNTFVVKRVNDRIVKDDASGVNTVDGGEDE